MEDKFAAFSRSSQATVQKQDHPEMYGEPVGNQRTLKSMSASENEKTPQKPKRGSTLATANTVASVMKTQTKGCID